MSPFRDPIIYPGEPEQPRVFTTQRHRICMVGSHGITPGTRVQLVYSGGVACLPHAADWEREQQRQQPEGQVA